MNSRLMSLNLILAAALGLVAWRLWANYSEDRVKREAFLRRGAAAAEVPGHQAADGAKPVQASSYLDVAQRMLFAKDRNPNVVIEIEAPPPPPPPPPVPPFPAAYGMLSFGGEVVVLLADNGKQKGYHLGDSVGPFKLSAIKGEELTLEWNGQTFKKTLAELKKLAPAGETAGGPSVGSAKPGVTSAALSPQQASDRVIATQVTPEAYTKALDRGNGPGVAAGFGPDRACDPSDSSPAGTIQGGYRKRVTPTPFGNTCIWEPVR